MADKSTPHQRLFLRTQMIKRELPTTEVTVLHRDMFNRAGIAWVDGMRMDALLESLSQSDVRRLVEQLRDDDQDDDEEDAT